MCRANGVSCMIRELSSESKDQSFVLRWTCLSLVVLRRVMERERDLRSRVFETLYLLGHDDRGHAQVIEESWDKAHRCLKVLFEDKTNLSKEQVERILRSRE